MRWTPARVALEPRRGGMRRSWNSTRQAYPAWSRSSWCVMVMTMAQLLRGRRGAANGCHHTRCLSKCRHDHAQDAIIGNGILFAWEESPLADDLSEGLADKESL